MSCSRHSTPHGFEQLGYPLLVQLDLTPQLAQREDGSVQRCPDNSFRPVKCLADPQALRGVPVGAVVEEASRTPEGREISQQARACRMVQADYTRSEERRVGKECRGRWAQ